MPFPFLVMFILLFGFLGAASLNCSSCSPIWCYTYFTTTILLSAWLGKAAQLWAKTAPKSTQIVESKNIDGTQVLVFSKNNEVELINLNEMFKKQFQEGAKFKINIYPTTVFGVAFEPACTIDENVEQ